MGFPPRQGLYDPANEHDSCGVGFVANIKGRKSHEVIEAGLQILLNLDHRGAVGADPLVGDGAGCLIQMPDALLRDWADKEGVVLPPPLAPLFQPGSAAHLVGQSDAATRLPHRRCRECGMSPQSSTACQSPPRAPPRQRPRRRRIKTLSPLAPVQRK